jgi:hypothetical protein
VPIYARDGTVVHTTGTHPTTIGSDCVAGYNVLLEAVSCFTLPRPEIYHAPRLLGEPTCLIRCCSVTAAIPLSR